MKFKKLIQCILVPNIIEEKNRRRAFILNAILLCNIILALVATLVNFLISFANRSSINNYFSLFALLFLLILYIISRWVSSKVSSLVLIILLSVLSYHLAYTWGTVVPQGIITLLLTIVMGGILIGARFIIILTTFHAIILTTLTRLQTNKIITYETWSVEPTLGTTLVFLFTFFIVCITIWLYTRELENSLKKCYESEDALKKERDSLEIKVEERTKELKQTQLEKVSQLYRLAEFGRMSSGFLHELSNPLTAISLNLSKLKHTNDNTIKETKENLSRAFDATKKMESFILAARKQFTQQEDKTLFSITEEIIQVVQILNYKAKKAKVEIIFFPTSNMQIYGDLIKFSQIITNLISNAIDSYENISAEHHKREVEIKLHKKDNSICLTIRDWGCGIPKQNIDKIFEPFYTTKGFTKGTGIGLFTVREFIKKDFGGRVIVGSKENKGTTFFIKIPTNKSK